MQYYAITYFVSLEMRIIAISMTVCLLCRYVYPVREHISKTGCPNFNKCVVDYCLWTSLDPPLAALRDVMYFRFCGYVHRYRRHEKGVYSK